VNWPCGGRRARSSSRATAALAQSFARDFETDYYHPRTSTDMMGVEVCAAFKNFFAIAVGWAHGKLGRPATVREQGEEQQCRRHPL
jgi:glycerol-3-phosphate dehydrogenase